MENIERKSGDCGKEACRLKGDGRKDGESCMQQGQI